jgi:hypothetical protein
MLCLVAFALAAVFSAFWSLVQSVGGSPVDQGLGLAFLAGFPLYACGGVLGAMATADATDPGGRHGGVGAPAALGAALGFAATGVSLPQVLTPASLFLMCLVLLSAGGLVYGSVLDHRLRVETLAVLPSPTGDVRVEDRRLLVRDRAARVLTEGAFVRRWVILDGAPVPPWDVAAVGSFGRLASGVAAEAGAAPAADHEARAGAEGGAGDAPMVLLVGGGASPVSSVARAGGGAAPVTVVERSRMVLELARAHLDTGRGEEEEGVTVRLGNLDDVLATVAGPFRTVLVDTAALGPVGGVAGLSAGARSRLHEGVVPGGVLVLGPLPPEPGSWTFPEGWRSARYRRRVAAALEGLGAGIMPEEVLLVGRRPLTGDGSPEEEWPEAVEDFVRDRTLGKAAE